MRSKGLYLILSIALACYAASPEASAEHKPTDKDCLACHADSSLTKEVNGKTVSLTIDAKKFAHSVHGGMLTCVDCHTDIKTSPHEATPAKVNCGTCHTDAQTAYAHSLHAKIVKPKNAPAAQCIDCHGAPHEITGASDKNSPVYHSNIPATCGRCHGQQFTVKTADSAAQTFMSYQQSVHGLATEHGKQSAAVCTDCHGDHAILPPTDPTSPINKFNVPKTCGKCHQNIQQVYDKSIHGQAVIKGNGLAPTCTDCHGIHSIKSHVDPNSSVSEQNVAQTTCARCHEGVQLTQEYGVAGNRMSTYLDSYHGLAAEGGSVVVANCASCHGVHNILPSSDPNSTINSANLNKTCGQCHQGVTARFTANKVHVGKGPSHDAGAIAGKWVALIYIPLIILVIGGMLLHNVIIWRFKALAKKHAFAKHVQRMTPQQRYQHLVLLVSFIVLVITGFALKYPESWFAHALGMSEKIRSIIHRIAGVALIAAGFYHLVYLALSKEGRKLFFDLLPTLKDAKDVCQAMLYYLGLSKTKPEFRRFNYAEKAEYWALVWGTGLMAVTGIMIWANVTTGNLLARWWVDAATEVHFYEAILATLAIIVWHFYQVFFDPDVYPMNWTWWDGKMPLDLYKHEHALDETATVLESDAIKSNDSEEKNN